MKYKYMLLLLLCFGACKQNRAVDTSFYYWKTVYKSNKLENECLKHFQSKRLYTRIMDVDLTYDLNPVPIAPISFADNLADSLEIVPVVFIVNEVLKDQSAQKIKQLAAKITKFVNAKIQQGGKTDFKELQIDCDWTDTTRDHYFELLKEIAALNVGKILSATLRLHQLKNQIKSGVPPVDKVLLMCYNMGNLRKFGNQNSILDVQELKKYVNQNLAHYPMTVDIALPIFSWAVSFRYHNYQGISKRIKLSDLQNTNLFVQEKDGLYTAKIDLPDFGLYRNDRIRYEESKIEDIKELAKYLSENLPRKPLNLIFYHLDEQLLKQYKLNELEEIAAILR